MTPTKQWAFERPAKDTTVLCAFVIVAPQLFGGAFPWAAITIAGLSLVVLATALWVQRSASHPVVDFVLVMMAIAWFWTCLQIMPWPEAVARTLKLGSLESAETLEGLEWAPEIPLTISRDPGSTLLQILIGISILSTFLAARLGGPSRLKPVAAATVASAVLLGVEGLLHRLSGAEAVFGVYTPRFTQPQLLTPLMNGNHLGGFALLGALLGAGLALERIAPSRRFWAFASGLCALTVAATLSRGAIGGLLFGFVLLAAWALGKGRGHRASMVPLAIPVAAAVGVATFAGLEPILRRFETQGFDKLGVAVRGFRLLEGPTWWLGIGRGAFSSMFVSEEGSVARYTHPENLIVQWTTEWGVPIGVGLMIVLAVALWKRAKTTDKPLVAAVCIGLGALSLQNLVDFSLEMAGIAVVAAALLGAVLPPRDRSNTKSSLRLSMAALVGFAVLLGAIGPRMIGSDVQSLVDRLTSAMRYERESEFRSALSRGLVLHPTEPAFALLAGTYAGVLGHPDAPRWLSIVMQAAPGWAAPHVVAAQWLLERGLLDQALVEIREAEQRHPGSAQRVVCEMAARFPSMEHLDRAAPEVELKPAYLDRASVCPGLPPSLRAQIDEAVLRSEPTRVNAVGRHARRLSSQGRHEQALALLQTALDAHPEDVGLWVALIRVHLGNEDPHSAEAALRDAHARELESRSLMEAQARVQAALGEADAMRATVARLRGRARGDSKQVAASFMLQAELEASLGNVDDALTAYSSADAVNSDTPALLRAAELALRSGRRNQARRAYETLCRRDPDGTACTKRAQLQRELNERPDLPARP